MRDDEILILKGHEVLSLFEGREAEVIAAVRRAYEAHAQQKSSLPHSNFLCFPDEPANRIIALPAYLGAEFGVAGIKWIASFPGNLARGIDRASAVIILNSAETGRPLAVIEGSSISAKRTAASASLAAKHLQNGHRHTRAGIVGAGVINFEIVRFLLEACPTISRLHVYDLDAARAGQFKAKSEQIFGQLEVEVAGGVGEVLESNSLVSFATTASRPYVPELSACQPGSQILHISLRDLAPEAILASDNVVDDADHVCRAETSIHLTERLVNHREFIRCTLGDVLLGAAPARGGSARTSVFSPFGLGVLDLAVAKLVYDLALREGGGMVIESFLPAAWAGRDEGHRGEDGSEQKGK